MIKEVACFVATLSMLLNLTISLVIVRKYLCRGQNDVFEKSTRFEIQSIV